MATTDYHGWPLPDGTDLPFVHLDMKALADAIDKELPILVDTIGLRDALPPILNLRSIVKSMDYQLYIHDGTSWKSAGGIDAHGLRHQGIATAGSGGFTALTVVNNIPSYTFKANRRYEIVWDGHHTSSVSGDIIDMQIATCSTADGAGSTAGLTVLRKKYYTMHGAGSLEPDFTRAPVTFGSDTTLQIKFLAMRNSGSGTVSISATSDATTLYQVNDLGAYI